MTQAWPRRLRVSPSLKIDPERGNDEGKMGVQLTLDDAS